MNSAQAYELALLFLCIWREARGVSFPAQLGVGWSVRNRVMSGILWWGQGWDGIILHPYQYSSFNASDPNSTKIPYEDDPSFDNCMLAATEAYSGTGTDPTQGATSYYSSDIAAPAWAATMTFTVQLDSLLFFKLGG
ncbi:MAG: cell wall hydrolase [Candidatus Acidiferrales bacterium]